MAGIKRKLFYWPVFSFVVCFLLADFFIGKTAGETYSDVQWDYYVIKKNEIPENIFGEYWMDVLRFNKIDRNHLKAALSISVSMKCAHKILHEIKDFFQSIQILNHTGQA